MIIIIIVTTTTASTMMLGLTWFGLNQLKTTEHATTLFAINTMYNIR